MAREGIIVSCEHCLRPTVVPDHHGEQIWCSIYCYERWLEDDPYRRS